MMNSSVLHCNTGVGRSPSLGQLFFVYLLIGSLGFGPALITETQKRVIRDNRWISDDEFLTGLALSQLLPGATYVSLATYIGGYKIHGILGAVTCFLAFLLPSFMLMLLLSYLYFSFGSLPQISLFFQGLSVIIPALLVQAVIATGKSAITDYQGLVLASASAGLVAGYSNIFMVLFLAAVAGMLLYNKSLGTAQDAAALAANGRDEQQILLTSLSAAFGLLVVFLVLALLSPILFQLSWVFFRMGAFLFGGGSSMLPFIEQEVVRNYQWLTQEQFIVGIALGQVHLARY